ncbi:MAG: cytochrome c biogenesis protein CcsA [Planctomycetia bacterium]|nr:cytochrome c biogenesis protein CcsA [Planctomycetia bacterium]
MKRMEKSRKYPLRTVVMCTMVYAMTVGIPVTGLVGGYPVRASESEVAPGGGDTGSSGTEIAARSGETTKRGFAATPDWSAWGQLPVMSRGRIRPLDTVARQWADEVTDRERPLVSPPDGDTPEAKLAAKILFPDGKTRRFMAGEILFGWMAAPHLWREIPVLRASHEELRTRLKMPLRDSHESRYRLTTIAEMEANPVFRKWVDSLAGTAEDEVPSFTPFVRSQLETLYGHAGMLYQFGLDPSQPLPVSDYQPERTYHVYRSHDRFLSELTRTISAWRELALNPLAREVLELPMRSDIGVNPEDAENDGVNSGGPQTAWMATGLAVMRLHRLTLSSETAERYGLKAADPDAVLSVSEVDASLALLENVARQTAERLTDARRNYFRTLNEEKTSGISGRDGGSGGNGNSDGPGEKSERKNGEEDGEITENGRTGPVLTESQLVELRTTAYEFRSLARYASGTRYALTMVSPGPAIVPSLDLTPLDPRRSGEELIPVWLDLRTVLCGGESLLADYPRTELVAVRQAWRDAVADYQTDRSDRDARLAGSLARLVEAIRTFGEAVNVKRDALIAEQTAIGRTMVDPELVTMTRYPMRSATRLEYFYNAARPFMITWATALASVIFFGIVRLVPLPRIRRLAFLAGCGWLLLSVCSCLTGFVLRMIISRRAPVATLFETLIFVGFVAAVLGLGLTFRGLTERGWRRAMLRTASPLGKNVRERLRREHLSVRGNQLWFVLRLVAGVGIFVLLSVIPYGESGRAILPLLPAGTSVGRMIAWNVGLVLLVASVWFVPRMIAAAVASVGTILWDLFHRPVSEMIEVTYERQIAAAIGAVFAFVTTFLAYWFPETFNPGMDRLMPVLGDQFWLASHVLTITASYGAGAIGWGLGNIALGYYLFGGYTSERLNGGTVRRPPMICETLASYNYFSILVAVCLLTLGTILGALWADVSWGRFWAWDQKEVWSLVTIFVYMVILHGRYTGWLGNFGMAAGATVGRRRFSWRGSVSVFCYPEDSIRMRRWILRVCGRR